MKISCVLLAAGFSNRMKENKLFLEFQGETMLNRTIRLLSSVKLDEYIIILSEDNAKNVNLPSGFLQIINPNPSDGQSSSVRLGTSLASGDCILFCTADQPYLNQESISLIIDKASENCIVVPTYKGSRGTPTCFGKRFYPDLLALEGAGGGKSIINNNIDSCVFVEMNDPLVLKDIDTPEDYIALLKSIS